MLLMRYETISEDLERHWGDAWQDPFAREWERLVRLTWRVLRRQGSQSIAWGLDTPERRLWWALRDGVAARTDGHVIVRRCPRLADLHEDMDRRFPEFLARYPRFALRLRLQDVSEDVNAQSWPYGYEWELWQWAGSPAEPAPKWVPASHHEILSRLRAVTEGWWLWVAGPPERRWDGCIEWRSAAKMDAIVAAQESANWASRRDAE